MRRKPLIGLNMDFGKVESKGYVAELPAGYFDCLIRAQAVPVAIPPLVHRRDIEQALDAVDGFVLIGGDDLDPLRDGCYHHPTTRVMHPRREDFDRLLVKLIAERHMPVLGIGAGMQLLNVSQGGTLSLNIRDDFSNAMDHRDPHDPYHRHGLVVTPKTFAKRVYGDGEIRVASRHHMAVLDLAPVFKVSAVAPDGIIEVIESQDPDWFAIGVQYHPECEAASALDLRVFEEFVAEVVRRQSAMQRAVA